MKHSTHRFTRLGVCVFIVLAVFWLLPKARADANRPLGPAADVCGTLSVDTVWNTTGGGQYTVTCPVIVPPGVTLTIEAGVRVEFNSGNNYLLVSGSLDVNGTASEPVLFTSSQANPAPGAWDRIGFEPGSTGDIVYAIVEYGGYSTYASIQVEGGLISIQNSVIRYSSQQGIRSKTWPTLIDNQFIGNADAAVLLNTSTSEALTITIRGNTGSGNGRDALVLDGNIPANLSLGENAGLPYVIEGTLYVPAGTGLTVGAGARFELGLSGQVSGAIEVGGGLLVQGTPEKMVYFTSVDGAGGKGQAGDWWRIYITSGATAIFEYTQISCGGAATASIYAEYASLTLEGVVVDESGGEGVYARNSHLRIANSVLENNLKNGVLYVLDTSVFMPELQIIDSQLIHNGEEAAFVRLLPTTGATLEAAGNTGWGNGINGIMLNAVFNDATLGFNPGLPYVIESVKVNAGATLAVEAGAVFKSSVTATPGGTLLEVWGSLVTLGSSASPVVFTSLYDCAYGGATSGGCPIFLPMMVRGSGSRLVNAGFRPNHATVSIHYPRPGDWRGIVVQPGGSVHLAHTVVQYAGYPSVGQIQVLGGAAELDHVMVRYGANHGVYVEDGPITVRNSALSDNAKDGLRINGKTVPMQPLVQDNVFDRNGAYAVYLILNGGGLGAGEFSGNHGSGNGLVNGIYVEGYITDQVSRLAANPNFPYVIWTLTVNAAARLTIEPGTVLKLISPPDGVGFARGTGSLIVLGEVEALGLAENPIVVTSFWDDTAGGDTNGGLLGSEALPGDWLGFIVRSTGQATLEYTEFRYGGSDGWNVWSDGGTISLAHGKVLYSEGNGIGGTGNITITYTEIRYNQVNGAQINGPASIEWSIIANNGQYGVVNYYTPTGNPTYRLPATNNYWGSASGPSYDGNPCPFDTPTGSGAMINCRVDWEPFLIAPPWK